MSLERLSRIVRLIAERGPEPSTSQLCEIATAVTGASGAGITLFTANEQPAPAASSNAVAREVGALQYTLGEGPCIDAHRMNRPTLEQDLAHSELIRWPAFAAAATAIGVRAIFGFPLRVGSVHLGSLDLYRDLPGPLDAEQHANALVVADLVARILLGLQAAAPAGELAEALTEHADFGYGIHQASGMVSVQLKISVSDAILRIRAHAYRSERPLGDVARDIVAGRLRFDDEAAN
jgi:GAF domain-containing protein